MNHEHDWRPVRHWPGRYQCADARCNVIGYRGIVIAHGPAMSEQRKRSIIPYICTRDKCGNPAVAVLRRKRYQRCLEHHDRVAA